MEDSPEDTHHVGMPGFDVIESEMNKNSNEQADEMSRLLMPVGTEMMQSGDSELDVDVSQSMKRKAERPASPAVETDNTATGETSGQQEEQLTNTAGQEVAEPAAEPLDIPEEMEDVEEQIPSEAVDPEAELPPTPTPTPTPDLEELARREEEERAFRERLDTCVKMAEENGYMCSEHQTPVIATLPEAAFDPANLRENLQSMILSCNKRKMTAFAHLRAQDGVEEATLVASRVSLADMAILHGNWFTCLNSPSFPSCLSEETKTVLQSGPSSDGEWPC